MSNLTTHHEEADVPEWEKQFETKTSYVIKGMDDEEDFNLALESVL